MRNETIDRFKRNHGAGCSGAPVETDRLAETGDAPSPRQTRVYHLARLATPRSVKPRRTFRELERELNDESKGSDVDCLHVRSYRGPDWFTTAGVLKKRKMIEAKGLPSFRLWRFLTLTFSRKRFDDPLTAYLAGKAKLRKFMHAAREAGLWKSDAKWCWKLEFQKDGWAHWHLLVERRERFCWTDFKTLNRLWGFGRVNVRMIRNQDFLYQFKYAFKPVLSDDAERHAFVVPAWFADYCGSRSVTVEGEAVEKPSTFSRARFWQTSKGFYTGEAVNAAASDKAPVSSLFPSTVREVIERKSCSVQVVARGRTGRYRASGVLTLSCLSGHFWDRVGFEAFVGGAIGLAVNSYVVPVSIINRNTQNKWLIHQLTTKNRLTLQRAAILQNNQVNLARC
jgi:hypothetical protein